MRKFKPQPKEKLQSIDEDYQTEIDISEAGFNYESVKRWALTGKSIEPRAQSLESSKAALKSFTPPHANSKPPFQSESTLVGSDTLHHDEKSSFKTRIQSLLYKPREPEKKRLAKPEIRDKSPSLLKKIGKLGTKFGQLNPFTENSLLGKKSGSTEFKPASEQSLFETKFIQRSKKSFEIKYAVLKELGAGGHSTVYLARNQYTNAHVVCKFIKDTSVWKWYKDVEEGMNIPYEIHVMRIFNQEPTPRAIEYIEHFHLGQGRFVIVMEYLGEEWCDLYEYIENHGPVREDHAREIFGSIVGAISAMHSLGFLHNDIKDENVIINVRTRSIKLIDFGSCTSLVPGKQATLFYGTKKFAAPEAITNESYDPIAQEVWALGALLYVILLKMDPFKTDEDILESDMKRKIQRLRMHGHNGVEISDDAVDAMLAMLEKNPVNRISVGKIKSLAFMSA